MHRQTSLKLAAILVVSALLVGCASHGRHVPRHHSYTSVEFGTVIATETVTIGGSRTGIGAYIGSAAAINDSTRNNFVGLVLRGLAGAFVGAATEEAVTRREGRLYTVELSNGPIIEVLSANKELLIGECVKVTNSGRYHTRIRTAPTKRCPKQNLNAAVKT